MTAPRLVFSFVVLAVWLTLLNDVKCRPSKFDLWLVDNCLVLGGSDVDNSVATPSVGPPVLSIVEAITNQEPQPLPVLVRVRRHRNRCLRRKRKHPKIKCPGPHKPRRPRPKPQRRDNIINNMNQSTHITIGERDDKSPKSTQVTSSSNNWFGPYVPPEMYQPETFNYQRLMPSYTNMQPQPQMSSDTTKMQPQNPPILTMYPNQDLVEQPVM